MENGMNKNVSDFIFNLSWFFTRIIKNLLVPDIDVLS